MRMLTRTAGVEFGPPASSWSGRPRRRRHPINASTEGDLGKLKVLDAAIPLGRLAEPKDIASVAAFGDGAASYLTATTIFADGGLMHLSPGL